jgi:kynureninase
VAALYACRAGYEIIREIGVDAIRAKSLALTRRLITRARDAGFRLNTPDEDGERGGTVILDVPNGAAVADDLIARGIIVDHRPGAGIRIAPHFYTTAEEIDLAIETLIEIAPLSRSTRIQTESSPTRRELASSPAPRIANPISRTPNKQSRPSS